MAIKLILKIPVQTVYNNLCKILVSFFDKNMTNSPKGAAFKMMELKIFESSIES